MTTTERLMLEDQHRVHLPSQFAGIQPVISRQGSTHFTLGHNSLVTNERVSYANRESENTISEQSKLLSYLDLDRYKTQSASNQTLEALET